MATQRVLYSEGNTPVQWASHVLTHADDVIRWSTGESWASFSTINVDQRGRKTGSERTVVVNCEPYPESLIHHGRHKTKSGGFSNSSDNVLSVFVYLFDKHISLMDTCLSYIYCYNIGPVKNWSYIFLHTKKIHNPSNTPKPWPVCNSYWAMIEEIAFFTF